MSFNVYSRVNTQLSATRTSSKRALTSGIKHVQQLHQVCDFCNSGSWSLASVLVLNFFYYSITLKIVWFLIGKSLWSRKKISFEEAAEISILRLQRWWYPLWSKGKAHWMYDNSFEGQILELVQDPFNWEGNSVLIHKLSAN